MDKSILKSEIWKLRDLLEPQELQKKHKSVLTLVGLCPLLWFNFIKKDKQVSICF